MTAQNPHNFGNSLFASQRGKLEKSSQMNNPKTAK